MRFKRYIDKEYTSPLEQVMHGRDIEDINAWLNAGMGNVADWSELDDIDKAAKAVHDCIINDKNVLLPVDCDQDGYASAAIFINYFHSIYPQWVLDHVKYVHHEGKQHGLSDIVDLIDIDDIDLVVCIDSASNDYSQHEYLNSNGVSVVILDHHLADRKSEAPLTITVNNQLCGYPNKTAVGGAIAWQFCRCYDSLYGYSEADKQLDLCALALIGDMASYKNLETKALIQEGLKHIKNPYMYSMYANNEYTIDKHGGKSYMGLAFGIVPMTNAVCRSGTLDEKDLVFKSMCTPYAFERVESDKRGAFGNLVPLHEEAIRVACNVKRRQSAMQDEALANIEHKIQENGLLDNAVLTITCEPGEVSPGIAGLIANKAQAKYQRPAMVLTKTKLEDGTVSYRGSMRNYSMSEENDFKKVLEDTGLVEYVQGHPNAAGCGVSADNLDKLNFSLNKHYENVSKEPVFYVDYIWGLKDIDNDIILELAGFDKFWGQEIPESKIGLVDIDLSKCQLRLCGQRNNTLRMILPDGTVCVKFGISEDEFDKLTEDNVVMKCLCSPQKNEWNGEVSGEFIIDEYEIKRQWTF